MGKKRRRKPGALPKVRDKAKGLKRRESLKRKSQTHVAPLANKVNKRG